jgi:3'-phosphoadenosine 5'-phosphosulfate sulfotransferase (PAPS reductase)/FAD synthetase
MSLIEIKGESKERLSLRSIERTLQAGHPLVVGWSAGKDSSVLTNLVLTAAASLAERGVRTPVVITHADTGVENPEIVALARNEIRKMREFIRARNLVADVMVGEPTLTQSWPVRVIGGRALPPFPDTRRDCTTDWKIAVNERNLKRATDGLKRQGFAEVVVATGVRRGESDARDAAIQARGERSDRPWRNDEGRLMLSAILEWELDDIWEYLGLANAKVIDAYSDFSDTLRVYADGGGTSCAVVSDLAMAKFAKPCSSRFGCWTCTAVSKDRSLTNMIEQDGQRYGYLQPLAALRNFLADTQYDWDRRQFVQRTIRDGHIVIAPDTYNPNMLAELLRYTLTAQELSGVSIISDAALVAIDARWSLYGLHPPFEAIRIWQDVVLRGNRYHPPVLSRPYPKTPAPHLGRIHVGSDWDDETSPLYADGLRHPIWELFSDSCGPALRTFANGKVGLDLEEGIEVDAEGASMFLEFEAERKASEPNRPGQRWVEGFLYYLTLGVVSPGKGQSSMVDELIRRTNWRQDFNLHGQRSPAELYERCQDKAPRQIELFYA